MLGVPKTASGNAIKSSHSKMRLLCYPDKLKIPRNDEQKKAKEKANQELKSDYELPFKLITNTFEVLFDPKKRKEYINRKKQSLPGFEKKYDELKNLKNEVKKLKEKEWKTILK